MAVNANLVTEILNPDAFGSMHVHCKQHPAFPRVHDLLGAVIALAPTQCKHRRCWELQVSAWLLQPGVVISAVLAV